MIAIDVINRCFINSDGHIVSAAEAKGLKDYQKRYLPEDVLKILQDDKLSDDTRAYAVFKWMYTFAQSILKGYQDCYAPFGGRWSNDVKTHLNLLSPKGEQVLKDLNQFQEQLKNCSTITEVENLWKNDFNQSRLLDILVGITAPKHFDLSLYKDYSPLFEEIGYNNTFSIVSGCYNACPHCGVEATAPYGIASLPFPLVQQIWRFCEDHKIQFMCYWDSDPIDYYDPVYQGAFLNAPWIITKGFQPKNLKNKDSPLYLKELRRRDALEAYKDSYGEIRLSCVDFGWEIFEQNYKRLYANIELLRGYNYKIQYYCQGDAPSKRFFLKHVNVPISSSDFGDVAEIGRASAKVYQNFVVEENIFNGGGSGILTAADGSVYWYDHITDQNNKKRVIYRGIGNFLKDPKNFIERLRLFKEIIKTRNKGILEQEFPVVIKSTATPALQDKKRTLPLLPVLSGKVVSRQYPNIPTITDRENLHSMRGPITGAEFLQKCGNGSFIESNGYLSRILKYPSNKDIAYGLTGDISDKLVITDQSNLIIGSALPRAYKRTSYVKIPQIITDATSIRLDRINVAEGCFQNAESVQISWTSLADNYHLKLADSGKLFISDSNISGKINIEAQEIDFSHCECHDLTIASPCKKLNFTTDFLRNMGQMPDILDLTGCPNLQELNLCVDTCDTEKKKIIFSSNTPQNVIDTAKFYYPAENVIVKQTQIPRPYYNAFVR